MKYEVTLDVQFSGEIIVEAESEKDAEEKVMKMDFSTLDRIKNFHYIGKDVYEIWQED